MLLANARRLWLNCGRQATSKYGRPRNYGMPFPQSACNRRPSLDYENSLATRRFTPSSSRVAPASLSLTGLRRSSPRRMYPGGMKPTLATRRLTDATALLDIAPVALLSRRAFRRRRPRLTQREAVEQGAKVKVRSRMARSPMLSPNHSPYLKTS